MLRHPTPIGWCFAARSRPDASQADADDTVVTQVLDVPCPMLCAGQGARRWVHDREVDVTMTMRRPLLWTVDRLLDPAECTELIELARARLRRSQTVVDGIGGSEIHAARTSEGMFFQRGEHPLCERLERRIAALMSWPMEHGEGLQVLRYGVGAEYRPHHDYFDPASDSTARLCGQSGQRVATVLVYLNAPEAGGETVFPQAGLSILPRMGSAVCFVYPHPEPHSHTLHGGGPVVVGEKWVATKWLRQRPFD